jgi:hypothetical protein
MSSTWPTPVLRLNDWSGECRPVNVRNSAIDFNGGTWPARVSRFFNLFARNLSLDPLSNWVTALLPVTGANFVPNAGVAPIELADPKWSLKLFYCVDLLIIRMGVTLMREVTYFCC